MISYWIKNTISNEKAYEDFQKWFDKIKLNLTQEIIKSVKSGDKERIVSLAIEMSAYDNIRRPLDAAYRELRSTLSRQDEKERR